MSTNGSRPAPKFQFTPPTGRNPVTTARFRRQAWWQITFPVLLVTLIGVGLMVLLWVLGGPSATSVVADYSVLILFFVFTLLLIPTLGLVGAISYLLIKSLKGIPPYTYVGQKTLNTVHDWTDDKMKKVSDAVISFRGMVMGLEYYLRARGIDISGGGNGAPPDIDVPETPKPPTGSPL